MEGARAWAPGLEGAHREVAQGGEGKLPAARTQPVDWGLVDLDKRELHFNCVPSRGSLGQLAATQDMCDSERL